MCARAGESVVTLHGLAAWTKRQMAFLAGGRVVLRDCDAFGEGAVLSPVVAIPTPPPPPSPSPASEGAFDAGSLVIVRASDGSERRGVVLSVGAAGVVVELNPSSQPHAVFQRSEVRAYNGDTPRRAAVVGAATTALLSGGARARVRVLEVDTWMCRVAYDDGVSGTRARPAWVFQDSLLVPSAQ